jgi:hypothetical protein
MSKPTHRPPFAQIAFLVVFGAFTLMGLYQVLDGTATKLTWLSFAAGAVLFVATAYRVSRSSGRPGA